MKLIKWKEMVSKGVFLWIFENTFSYGTPPLAASDLILENIIKAASGCNISLLFTNCSGVFLCSSVQYFQYFFYRSSRRGVFFKKDVFKNVAKFAENHQCQSLFNKVTVWGLELYLKKLLWHKCFLVNFGKFWTFVL